MAENVKRLRAFRRFAVIDCVNRLQGRKACGQRRRMSDGERKRKRASARKPRTQACALFASEVTRDERTVQSLALRTAMFSLMQSRQPVWFLIVCDPFGHTLMSSALQPAGIGGIWASAPRTNDERRSIVGATFILGGGRWRAVEVAEGIHGGGWEWA
mgnify:CR=1 FL=1